MREADSDVLQIQDEDDHFHDDYIPDAQNSIEASERMAIPDSGPPAEQKSPQVKKKRTQRQIVDDESDQSVKQTRRSKRFKRQPSSSPDVGEKKTK